MELPCDTSAFGNHALLGEEILFAFGSLSTFGEAFNALTASAEVVAEHKCCDEEDSGGDEFIDECKAPEPTHSEEQQYRSGNRRHDPGSHSSGGMSADRIDRDDGTEKRGARETDEECDDIDRDDQKP